MIFKQSILKPYNVVSEYFVEKIFSDSFLDIVTISSWAEYSDEFVIVIKNSSKEIVIMQ